MDLSIRDRLKAATKSAKADVPAKKGAPVKAKQTVRESAVKVSRGSASESKGETMFKARDKAFYQGHEVIVESAKTPAGMVAVRSKNGIAVVPANKLTKKAPLNEAAWLSSIPTTWLGSSIRPTEAFDLDFDDIISIREEGENPFAKKDDSSDEPSDAPKSNGGSAPPKGGNSSALINEPGADGNPALTFNFEYQPMPKDAPSIPDADFDNSGHTRDVEIGDYHPSGGKTNGGSSSSGESDSEPTKKDEPEKAETKESAMNNVNRFMEAWKKQRGGRMVENGESIALSPEAAMIVLGTMASKQTDLDTVAKVVDALCQVSSGAPLSVDDLQGVQDAVNGQQGGQQGGSDQFGGQQMGGQQDGDQGGQQDGGSVSAPQGDGEPADSKLDGSQHDGKDKLMATESVYAFDMDDRKTLTESEEIRRIRRNAGLPNWWKK